jgi:hypothetical protein
MFAICHLKIPKHSLQRRYFTSVNDTNRLIDAIKTKNNQTIASFINDKTFVPDEDTLSAIHLYGNKRLLNLLLRDYRVNSDNFRHFVTYKDL